MADRVPLEHVVAPARTSALGDAGRAEEGVGAAPAGGDDALAQRIVQAQAALAAKEFETVEKLLETALESPVAALDQLIDCAELLAKAQRVEQSDALYESLLKRFTGNRRLHFLYGKRLFVRGLVKKAVGVFGQSAPFAPGSNPYRFIDHANRLMQLLEQREGRPLSDGDDGRLLAMKHAILAFAARKLPVRCQNAVGRISLVTGGLGPGGAERQLSRTAAKLEHGRRSTGKIGSIELGGQVEVLVRSHSGGEQRDFYLPDLIDVGVEVHEIDKMPAAFPSEFGIEDDDLALLADYLPHKSDFGTRRLVPHYRHTKPDLVSLWQDGSCLFAGLAALIAGVPRIQLVIRGLPPVIRTHMFHPHYEEMYRAMAKVPGVEFVSNSRAAAVAYAQWLDISIERFSILYNGVQEMSCTPNEELDRRWNDFEKRTRDASHTVGGVFRFDIDKRPATWIRYAIRHSRKYPDSRFVLVGDGRLLDEAVALAADNGIGDRILFVGHSSHVGYWMSKMDVLVLMSSFEGLPNVLIEAQFLGVPVVSTPAGGASECFVEGVSGHILSCQDKTDLDEACDKVHALLGRARDPAIFGPVKRDFLEPNFAVSRMVENFANLACGVPSSAA